MKSKIHQDERNSKGNEQWDFREFRVFVLKVSRLCSASRLVKSNEDAQMVQLWRKYQPSGCVPEKGIEGLQSVPGSTRIPNDLQDGPRVIYYKKSNLLVINIWIFSAFYLDFRGLVLGCIKTDVGDLNRFNAPVENAWRDLQFPHYSRDLNLS